MTAKTLPCPFCGEDPPLAVERNSFAGIKPHYVVACENEDCSAQPIVDGATLDEVWKRWNTRAPRRVSELELAGSGGLR